MTDIEKTIRDRCIEKNKDAVLCKLYDGNEKRDPMMPDILDALQDMLDDVKSEKETNNHRIEYAHRIGAFAPENYDKIDDMRSGVKKINGMISCLEKYMAEGRAKYFALDKAKYALEAIYA